MEPQAFKDFLDHPPKGEMKVSMSKAGVFLTANGDTQKITIDQAEILWDVMPLWAQLSTAKE